MNRVYIGDRELDPPEKIVMVKCTYCRKVSRSANWIKNHGNCPVCHEAYAGHEIEED